VVNIAKELGTSQGFPPGEQFTGEVLTQALFSDSCGTKKRVQKGKIILQNMLILPMNFRITAGCILKQKIFVILQILGQNDILCLIGKKVQIYHARSLYIVMLTGAVAYVFGCQIVFWSL
jgi:hypothetical protein